MNKLYHPFHLVTISPWPILISFRILNNLISIINWFNFYNYKFYYIFYLISLISISICIFQWWRDIIRESTFQGFHTISVYKNLRFGIILFIISEIIFFLSFFWTYFHSSLAPSIEIGQIWPPYGIYPFNPYDIPLLNTIILVSSGLRVTWSHNSLIKSNFNDRILRLLLTIILGIIFTLFQLYEYYNSPFSLTDSIYGSTFFITTGFHGLHVIIGSTFLIVCLFRMYNYQFSNNHHFGYEAAIWYWHFVDIIWLLLYIIIYWWRFYLYSIYIYYN